MWEDVKLNGVCVIMIGQRQSLLHTIHPSYVFQTVTVEAVAVVVNKIVYILTLAVSVGSAAQHQQCDLHLS